MPPNTTSSQDLDPLTVQFFTKDFPEYFYQVVRKHPQRYMQLPAGVLGWFLEDQPATTLKEAVKIYAIYARAENKSERS